LGHSSKSLVGDLIGKPCSTHRDSSSISDFKFTRCGQAKGISALWLHVPGEPWFWPPSLPMLIAPEKNETQKLHRRFSRPCGPHGYLRIYLDQNRFSSLHASSD
jgi:hypothetical protein